MGPPPDSPEVPPWPPSLDMYEQDHCAGMARHGHLQWRPLQEAFEVKSKTRWTRDGLYQGDRASTHGLYQGDRASTHGLYQGDRAGNHGVCPGDRAGNHEVCPGGRAGNHGVCPGGRAGNHGVCHENRASSHGNECGNRAPNHTQVTEDDDDDVDPQVQQARDAYWKSTIFGSSSMPPMPQEHLKDGIKEILKEMNERRCSEDDLKQLVKEVERLREKDQDRGRREDRSDEGLRSFPITLPQLPEPTVPNASLEAGDWVTQVRPLINDVSSAAATWWATVEEATAIRYQQWLSAAPLDKLKIMAPSHQELSRGHERLAQRVSVMLMQAIPQSMKQELIASRQMDATNILFRIYRTYQPGGLAERRQTLSQLTSTSVAQTPQAAVQSLRLWKRQAQRARELKAALPDPILQAKALTTIMEEMLAKDPQAAFRVNSHRMTNGIDVAPTEDDIDLFYNLLMAEAELMSTSNPADPTSSETVASRHGSHVKAMQASPNKSKDAMPCKFWGHEGGCRHGRLCKFQHDWSALPDKAERCWNCSAKGHHKQDCPTVKKEEQMPGASGGSAPSDKSSEGGGKSKGKKGKSNKTGKGATNGKSDAKQPEEGKSQEGKQQAEDQPSVKVAEKVEPSKEEATGGTGNQDALITEVTSLLKSLRVQGAEPQIRMVKVKSLQPQTEHGHTLIDGGATHCLRTRRNDREWQEAREVNVKLASGEVRMRQHPKTATLLVEDSIQAIVPVSKLTECGYSVHWDREACRIEHVRHGRVPVEMNQGCPTVDADWGEKLMAEIEEMELKRAKVRAVMMCGALAEDEYEKQVAELQALYPQVPFRILERIPGERDWDPDQLPFNRRRRRQVEHAKAVVINMCSGSDVARWKELESKDTVVLNIDTQLGVNAMDPHVAGYLESVIATGKVIAWTAGPPCRTISLCRQRGLKDGGPAPLRARHGDERFGLKGISGSQQELTDHDAALWLKNLWYMRKVKRVNPSAMVMLEQPQDPAEWTERGQDCPTFLNWPETKQLICDYALQEVRINQGDFGHTSVKPTTLITDMPEVIALQDESNQTSTATRSPWPSDLEDRLKFAKGLAAWAPGLVHVIKMAVKHFLQRAWEEVPNSGAGGSHSTTSSPTQQPGMKALNSKEREAIEAWKTHAEMGHHPYRRDCGICVEAMGRDRPRRRVKGPEPFTLSLDVAGPFVPGKDQMEIQPRYFVVATMTIPMLGDKPMVESLRKLAGDDAELDVPGPPIEDDGQNSWDEFVAQHESDQQKEELKASESKDPPPAAESPEPENPDPFNIVGRPGQEESLTDAQVQELDAANQRWKEFIAGNVDRPVKTLTMAVPTKTKKAVDVVKATAQVVARLRALQIPINRVHTDRGKEFIGGTFRNWVRQRDYFHTTTAGDEPSSNARAESEINVLKNRTRVLLRSAQCQPHMWPLALRHASEERFRRQLQACGVPTPSMLPFGIHALAKQKSWQHRYEAWRNPMTPVRVWGPAWDMSMTSKGYYLEILETGKMMRSTVVVVPKAAPAIVDAVPAPPAEQLPEQPADEVASVSYAPSIAEGENLDEDHPAPPDKAPPDLAIMDDGQDDGVLVGRSEVELELHPPGPGDNGVPSHDPPRRRLRGKQPGQPHLADAEPTLRPLRVGGECSLSDEATAKCWHEQQRKQDREEELQVLEHEGLTKWVQEERWLAKDPASFNAMVLAEETLMTIEEQLEGRVRMKKVEVEEEEILQTRVIPLEEVREDLEAWKPAFQKEYDSLLAGPVQPIFEQELKDMEKRGIKTEVLPAKAIASKKPPNKRKGRIVVCGNFAQSRDDQDVSVGGVCAMAVRGVVHSAACNDWTLGSIDVTGAFLQAPRRERGVVTIVQPPRLLQQMKIVKATEKWKVCCALYGMVESPGDWAIHRDGRMKKISWQLNGLKFWLEPTAEHHLWRVCRTGVDDDANTGETAGWIAVYVDDFLVAMSQQEIGGAFEALKQTWKCSQEEIVTEDHSMRFCGYEIEKTSTGGYYVKQEGYIQDVLDKYQIVAEESQPLPKIEDDEDELTPSLTEIRKAQAIVGELQWLSNRTRPDISFAIGVLARLMHRRPEWTVKAGFHVLRCLKRTKSFGLRYESNSSTKTTWNQINIYADTSFAPPHEKYRSVHGILVEHGSNIIAWESCRQAFITQSTAEAELIGYNEAYQVGEAVSALLQVLEINTKAKKIMGDSKAAIAQLTGDTGPWRTRHLRLRSAKLREALRDPCQGWEIEHKKGGELVADGLTKSLQGSAFQRFLSMLKMKPEREPDAEVASRVAALQVPKVPSKYISLVQACAVAAVAMLKYDVVIAGMLFVAVYALREVVGRAMKGHQDPDQDRNRIPKKCGGKGGKPYGFDRSGTVTQVGAGLGIPQVGDPQDHVDVALGVGTPGIRAFRIPAVRIGGRSHGSSSGSGSQAPQEPQGSRRAVQRGRAAMVALDRRAEQLARNAGTSSTTEAGNESEDSGEQLSSLEEVPAIQELQSMLENLELSERQPTRENLRSSAASSGDRRAAPVTVDNEVREPWNLPEFERIETSSRDKWNLTLWSHGWAIKEHHKPRVRAFNPIHSSTPFNCSEIESVRFTQKIGAPKELIQDEWTSPTQWKGERWVGYTFFRLKGEDDSFELVR